MATVSLTPAVPAVNPDLGGDARYEKGLSVENPDTPTFGRTATKGAVSWGAVMHYDTSSIPLGAFVSDWSIEVKASSSDSIGMTETVFSVMELDSRLNRQTTTYHDARIRFSPDADIFPSLTSLWDDEPASHNITFERIASIRSGIGNVGQTWVANSNASLGINKFFAYLGKSGSTGGAKLTLKLYTATGSSGAYSKDTLIAETDEYDVDSFLPTGSVTLKAISGNDFTIADPFVVTEGVRYHLEFDITGGSGDESIKIGVLDTFDSDATPNVPADEGAVDNMTVYAYPGRKLQGFRARTNFLTGDRIHAVAAAAAVDDIDGVINFTSGSNYTFGPTAPPHDLALPNFQSALNAALGARASLADDFLGIRISGVAETTDSAERIFHGQNSTTATRDSLKGAILTISYLLDSDYLRRYEHTPAPNILMRR